MKVSKSLVRPIVEAAFPSYKGRKFFVQVVNEVTLCNLNWDGGSRDEYRIVRLSDMKTADLSSINMPAPWNNKFEGNRLVLSEGYAVVRHSIFCGHDSGLGIFVLPGSPLALTTEEASS